jgi:hypothetical protein
VHQPDVRQRVSFMSSCLTTRTVTSQLPKMGFEGFDLSCRRLALLRSRRAFACEFSFRRRAHRFYHSRHPVPEEGALAIVTERWDGMRWTRRHRARDAAQQRALRAGVRSTLHGVVFAIFCPGPAVHRRRHAMPGPGHEIVSVSRMQDESIQLQHIMLYPACGQR